MSDGYLEWLPPLDGSDEQPCNDEKTHRNFLSAAEELVSDQTDITFLAHTMSNNIEFGPILRLDFLTPDTLPGGINRIMVWNWSDGTLGHFFGLNIPGRPL